MIRELVQPTDPILRQECDKFDFADPQMDPKELEEMLKLNMVAHKGIGLSACQIGLPYRVFAVGDYTNADSVVVMFNPNIVDESDDQILIEEGCLSFPGLFIKVKRSESIRIRFMDSNGEINTASYDGIPARAILHEYDHLSGIVFKDRASSYHLNFAKQQKKKLDKLRRKNNEKLRL
jgi:peptide deformylase